MTITYFFLTLNHHEAPVVDELYKLIGDDLTFVELYDMSNEKDGKKGSTEDFSNRPYLLKAWESLENEQKAMELARTSDVAMFCGFPSLRFQIERLKENRLSFEVSERWLKRGLIGMLSPRLLKVFLNFHLRNWRNRPLYRLCSSAFAAGDHARLGMYKGKCFKWGYFTSVGTLNENEDKNENLLCGCEKVDSEILMQHQPLSDCSAWADILQSPRDICFSDDGRKTASTSSGQAPVEASTDVSTSEITPLMWCSRFLMLKHPELPILLARKLKDRYTINHKPGSINFHLDMYGEGEYKQQAIDLVESLGLADCVSFIGNKPNTELMEDMKRHEIFLFTSDKNEGWGAVANESMSNGCVLVGSDALGCAPYLIKDSENGFMFKSSKVSCSFGNPDMEALDSLYEKVVWLLEHPMERKQMQRNAVKQMQEAWSPQNAAQSLLQLIDDIKNGKETSIQEGPCSKA